MYSTAISWLYQARKLVPAPLRRHPILRAGGRWLHAELTRNRATPTDREKQPLLLNHFRRSREELNSRCNDLSRLPAIDIVLVGGEQDQLVATLQSLSETCYPDLRVSVISDDSACLFETDEWQSRWQFDGRAIQCSDLSANSLTESINCSIDESESDFIGILRAGDLVDPSLFVALAEIAGDVPDADVIYTDEWLLDRNGRVIETKWKPAWSPELALSQPYTGRSTFYRTSLLKAAGYLNRSAGSAAEWDLMLRLTEMARSIVHRPEVLLATPHSMAITNSVDLRDAQFAAGQALNRRGMAGTVRDSPTTGIVSVRPQPQRNGRVSIIIPTRDRHELLKTCVDSIVDRTHYSNFEIVVVDNESQDPATHELLNRYVDDGVIRVVSAPGPFNFSRLNNEAAATCDSEYLLLLNNDTEVIAPHWLDVMVAWAEQRDVGAVGAKLYFTNRLLQHTGVVLRGEGSGGKPCFHSHKNFAPDAPGHMGLLHSTCNYSAVTGACLLVRRCNFESVGGLEERLAVAYNDIDLCLKLRQLGLRSVWTPEAELFHHESASRTVDKSRNLRWQTEQLWMHDRWGDSLCADPYYNPNLTLERSSFSSLQPGEPVRGLAIRVAQNRSGPVKTKREPAAA